MSEHIPQVYAYVIVLLIYVFGMWPCRKIMAKDSAMLGFLGSVVLGGVGLLIVWCGFFMLNHFAAASVGVVDKSLTNFRYVPTPVYIGGGIVVLLALIFGGKRKVTYKTSTFVNPDGSINRVGTKTYKKRGYRGLITEAYAGWNCRRCGFKNEEGRHTCVNCGAWRSLRTM